MINEIDQTPALRSDKYLTKPIHIATRRHPQRTLLSELKHQNAHKTDIHM